MRYFPMKNMLIITDSIIDRSILKGIFCDKYLVFEANKTSDALKFINESINMIDIILLDIISPSMDGKSLLKILSTDSNAKNIPVIAISNKEAGSETEKYAFENGVFDVIFTPFDTDIVKLRVDLVADNATLEKNKKDNLLLLKQQHTQTQLQGIMDNMDGGVAMFEILSEKESKLIYSNNGFGDIFGYSQEELANIDSILTDEHIINSEYLYKKINRSLLTKEKFQLDAKAITKNGRNIYLQILGSILPDQGTNFPVALLIFNDISDLKNYELELTFKVNEISRIQIISESSSAACDIR